MFPLYETKINTVLTALATKQATYFSMYGKYWQGVKTSTTIPSTNVSIQNTLTKPSGIYWAWKDIGLNGTKIPFSIEVHEYLNEKGRGYVVYFLTKYLNEVYGKAVGYGVDATNFTQDWDKLLPQWL
jgi:hypothetical protein